MKLLDRLTGARVDARQVAQSPLHLGRWTQIEGDLEWVLTTPDGGWTLPAGSSGAEVRGEGFADSWPEGTLDDALRALGEELHELHELDASWDDWAQQCPIPKNLAEALEPEPLEADLTKEIRYLEAVCRNPHTHIELHSEQVALGRARKLDRRAPQYLAAHSEDWAARRISGVVPRRLLALVREPRWDLYENCVAARLVDHLIRWFRRRVAILQQIQSEILAELDTKTAGQGSYQRRARLCAVWGDAWDDDRFGASLRTALARAERFLHRLLGLMNSPLYRQVPRNVHVELHLRSTNLWRHDDNYRGVARLWRSWAKVVRPRPQFQREREVRARALATAFESWCVLLVVRACGQLNLGPSGAQLERPLERGLCLTLDAGLELLWTKQGTIVFREGSAVRVEFVPLLQSLERGDGSPNAARVQPLVEAVKARAEPGWRVVLHLGTAPESPIARVQAPPLPDQSSSLDFVRVSPLALDGVERVARALRWAIWAPKMLAYPPRVEVPPAQAPNWPLIKLSEGFALNSPLPMTRLAELARACDEARVQHGLLEAEHRQVSSKARAAHGDRRKQSQLNRSKNELNARVQARALHARELEALHASLAGASAILEELRRCPVCAGRCTFQPRAQACFIACCERKGCGAQLELQMCPTTSARIPVLLLESARELDWGAEPSAARAAALVGADFLALPHAMPDGSLRFALRPRSQR